MTLTTKIERFASSFTNDPKIKDFFHIIIQTPNQKKFDDYIKEAEEDGLLSDKELKQLKTLRSEAFPNGVPVPIKKKIKL